MACGLVLRPAGAATAAILWPCLPLPAPCRSFLNEVQLNQVRCMNQLCWKQPLSGKTLYSSVSTFYRTSVSAPKLHGSRSLVGCSSSDSSAEEAAVSRPADASTAQSDQSMTRRVDLVPGALIVISGYWIGPDMDDGGGSVEAMLQRIV